MLSLRQRALLRCIGHCMVSLWNLTPAQYAALCGHHTHACMRARCCFRCLEGSDCVENLAHASRSAGTYQLSHMANPFDRDGIQRDCHSHSPPTIACGFCQFEHWNDNPSVHIVHKFCRMKILICSVTCDSAGPTLLSNCQHQGAPSCLMSPEHRHSHQRFDAWKQRHYRIVVLP